MLRNYGSEKRYYNKEIGVNSRLDEMQAAFLRIRLKHIKEMTEEKITLGERYASLIDNPLLLLPKRREKCGHVYHQFVIRCKDRDRLIDYLSEYNIGSIIHYPIPPHLAEGYQYLGHKAGEFSITEEYANEVLSIPIYNGMTIEEQDYVIEKLNQFR